MNERQLTAAFRDLDVPVTPDPAFAESLFTTLRREARPRQTQRLVLLLVAALLFAVAVGIAVVGSRPPNPLQTDVLPRPTAPQYTVTVPAGVDPASSTQDVEGVMLGAGGGFSYLDIGRRIDSMEWIPAGAEFTLLDGSGLSYGEPFWAVGLVADGTVPMPSDGPTHLFVYLSDATLEILGSDYTGVVLAPTPDPVPSLAPTQLLLVRPDGTILEPDVIPIADADPEARIGGFTVHGGAIWIRVEVDAGAGDPYLLRIDPDTLEESRWPIAGDQTPSVFVPGTGPEPTVLPDTGDEQPLALDEDGLWAGEASGIRLLDPRTGKLIRSIPTLEGEGHAYRRFGEPPAFGSLWDYDRGTHVVRRVDPVTGETQAEIPIPDGIDHESCGDPRPLRGVAGLPELLAARCRDDAVLVDPAANRFLRIVRATQYGDTVVAGAWVAADGPGYDRAAPWQEPGGLVLIDPDGGPTTPLFTLNHAQTGVLSPVVAGDALWFVAGVRQGLDRPYSQQPRLVRVSLDDLNLEGGR